VSHDLYDDTCIRGVFFLRGPDRAIIQFVIPCGMNLPLLGIHHVTAITARAADNLQFYTQVLGLRLVKKTVNQDDVSAYHLFYADAKGSPGTDLTFFDWAAMSPRRLGNRMITHFIIMFSSFGRCRRVLGSLGRAL
jgi:glyoxalase family protein